MPISPTPLFFNMVRCLTLSLRRFGGPYRDAPVIVTVGDRTVDPTLPDKLQWLGPCGVQLRWLPPRKFRADSFYATALHRFSYCFESDVVLMLDADVLVARPFDELIQHVYRHRLFAGMIAHVSPFEPCKNGMTWQRLYQHCGLGTPRLIHEHTGWGRMSVNDAHRYCPPYFNLGVLCAPRAVMQKVGGVVEQLMHRIAEVFPSFFRCQLAVSLAITSQAIPYCCLPMRYNFANDWRLELLHASELPHVRFVHLLRDNQVYKTELFASLENIGDFVKRTDLKGINRLAQTILESAYAEMAQRECTPSS